MRQRKSFWQFWNDAIASHLLENIAESFNHLKKIVGYSISKLIGVFAGLEILLNLSPIWHQE